MTFLEWHHQKFGAFLNRQPPFHNLPVIKKLPSVVFKFFAVTVLYFPCYGFIWIPLWYRSAKKNADQNQSATIHRGVPGAQFGTGSQGVATQHTQSHSGGTAMSQGFDGNGPCKACGFVYQMKFEQAVCPSCSHRMSRDDAFFACAGYSGPTPTASQQPVRTGTQAPASQGWGQTWANIWHGKFNPENPYFQQNVEQSWATQKAAFSPTQTVFFDCPQCGSVLRSDSGLPDNCHCSRCNITFHTSNALNFRSTPERPLNTKPAAPTRDDEIQRLREHIEFWQGAARIASIQNDTANMMYAQNKVAEGQRELDWYLRS